MPRPLSLVGHIKKLEYVARSLGECLVDLSESQQGKDIYYNMDFSLLCPVLFSKPGSGSAAFVTSPTPGIRHVLHKEKGEGHYDLVVTGPTIMEFYDQLEHLVNHLQLQRMRIPHTYTDMTEKELRRAIMTSDDIRRELSQFTEQTLDERVRAPINHLLQLLASNTIRGIGDVVDIEGMVSRQTLETFDVFLAQQRHQRLAYDSGRRSVEDSVFHYKADAVNNCLTLAAADAGGARALFVTSTQLNMRQCTVGRETYARVDRTPLFMLNAARAKRANRIGDESRFIERALRDALELLEELGHEVALERSPISLQLRLGRFYQDHMSVLEQHGSHGAPPDTEIDDLVYAVRNREGVENLLDEAVEDVRTGAQLIEMQVSDEEMAFIEQFDFADDPVLARMRQNLGVLT